MNLSEETLPDVWQWQSPVAERVHQLLGNKTGGVFVEAGAGNEEWL